MESRKETVVAISMKKMNIYLFILTIFMFFAVHIVHVLLYGEVKMTVTLSGMLLFLLAMLIIICLHEAIHLVGFHYIGGVPWKEMAWGVNLKLGVAYAHSKQTVTVKQMKKVLLLPLLPTGILPLLVGIGIDFPALSILGVILTIGCFGDLILYKKLLPFSDHALVIDHPTKPQFKVYE
ncbi:metalloprotease family protein [Oceanobacillus halophilus]|uniref:DUF3267 domain-containing protein n=1 Tax=Oceanobacillus halophilus TaxID=930130 RepID=A0A495A517_9BACI|nr:metalloprotease family protein [Oceanobacillus halophilus]RKQ34728.1 DUF3267 domain-containing protein [Oceanobacillus halophilus]